MSKKLVFLHFRVKFLPLAEKGPGEKTSHQRQIKLGRSIESAWTFTIVILFAVDIRGICYYEIHAKNGGRVQLAISHSLSDIWVVRPASGSTPFGHLMTTPDLIAMFSYFLLSLF